jgi:hypothetical protein
MKNREWRSYKKGHHNCPSCGKIEDLNRPRIFCLCGSTRFYSSFRGEIEYAQKLNKPILV